MPLWFFFESYLFAGWLTVVSEVHAPSFRNEGPKPRFRGTSIQRTGFAAQDRGSRQALIILLLWSLYSVEVVYEVL